ncbi:hypothetical protein NQ314_019570 [Rhamnusium bicolor]|uniref:Uncharacterized protein n=1 Tax=Rhamnusium bicolor TaxID=1586634 RepID=A0AAV8WMJ8_9CUCU|nr:hypothetical protein NQ314_019570 [Rhamnusium bicolor]
MSNGTKDGHQFFRCIGDGTVQEFAVEGVTFRYSKFASVGSCPVTLIALTAKSAGEYRCEVTLDSPRFDVEFKTTRLDLLTPLRRTQENPDMDAKASLGGLANNWWFQRISYESYPGNFTALQGDGPRHSR